MTIDWRILSGLTIILVIAFATLLVINADLRANLAAAKAENAALHIDNADFKFKISKQNQAIAAFEQQTAERKQRAATAQKAAHKSAAHYTAAAVEIEKQQPSGDVCKATKKLIDTYLEKP